MRPVIPKMRAQFGVDLCDALRSHFFCGAFDDRGKGGFSFRDLLHRCIKLHFAERADFGQAHAVGRQNACIRVHKNLRHAKRIGNETGMLTACSTKALQRVLRHIMATQHADLLDRVRHVVDGDLQKAFGDVLW